VIAQPLNAEEPLLIIVANAVAVLPTCTDRLDGNTAATSEPVFPLVIRPMRPLLGAVNQSAPSGPVAIASRCPQFPLDKVQGYSVIEPAVVMRPILPISSVNHRAPSGPAAIPIGEELWEGSGNSLTTPDVVIRPMVPFSVNQSAPSDPAAIHDLGD
jgi:hypothetical protein